MSAIKLSRNFRYQHFQKIITITFLDLITFGVNIASAQSHDQEPANQILSNPDFTKVLQKGDSLLSGEFNGNKGFYEWDTVFGKPQGSAKFKGSAEELMEMMESLQHSDKRPM